MRKRIQPGTTYCKGERDDNRIWRRRRPQGSRLRPEDAGRLHALASELASRGFEVRLTPQDRVPDKLAVTNPVSMHYAEVTDQDWVAWWAWADTPEDAGVTQIADELTRILGRPGER